MEPLLFNWKDEKQYCKPAPFPLIQIPGPPDL